MKTYFSPIQSGLVMAFSRLQMWFDPAQTGSPYDISQPDKREKGKMRLPLFTKKLSMRM